MRRSGSDGPSEISEPTRRALEELALIEWLKGKGLEPHVAAQLVDTCKAILSDWPDRRAEILTEIADSLRKPGR